ncbi:MAG: right-handed parallel beta-helix repeat-containing protein, partial [Deltaproteobacteria bacterium]
GTGQDRHSILVDHDIFLNVAPPDPDYPTKIYAAEDLDFRLQPASAAVDAGCILPNINDDFTGEAPDLGALEEGQPVPVYGPRP